ncbi:hypothetical protein L1F30_01900 [Simiduia sp. 21SJ11W-1]|uniref:hypothetical protein n=1 Tax=Simiduia sp. 21SJ11W-1 TaxID=2909669 RepID=UPI00209E02D7|nr:hypothetical protein [Simiduia sp. 21SJ11W-1]UTA48308.1 hypothetical protein L1F30_01900 [Simiduia sp. 21SJ11W-1]
MTLRNFFITLAVSFIALTSLVLSAHEQHNAHDVYRDDHTGTYAEYKAAEHRATQARIAALKGAERYACELIAHGHQCREYAIPDAEQEKLLDLKSGCESLPGAKLLKQACPTASRIGLCQHIVRNHHDPASLIYNNIYYSGEKSPWNEKEIARVCEDLEGVLALPKVAAMHDAKQPST